MKKAFFIMMTIWAVSNPVMAESARKSSSAERICAEISDQRQHDRCMFEAWSKETETAGPAPYH